MYSKYFLIANYGLNKKYYNAKHREYKLIWKKISLTVISSVVFATLIFTALF